MQALFVGLAANPATVGSNYASFDGKSQAWNATEVNLSQAVPHALTLDRLHVAVQVAPGAGKSRSFTVVKNGTPTSLTCTIAGTATAASDDNPAHAVSFAAGDLISLQTTAISSPGAPTAVVWTARQDAVGMFAVLSSCVAISASTFIGPTGNNFNATNQSVQAPVPFGCTIQNFYVRVNVAPGAGTSWTIALQKEGTDQAVTVTIADAAKTASDLAHNFTMSAGNRLSIHATATGAVASSTVFASYSVVPDTDGDAFWLGAHSNTASNSATNYGHPHLATTAYSAAPELVGVSMAPVLGCTLKGLYVNSSGAPGAAKSYTITVRKNGATNTAVSVVLSGAAQTNGTITDQSEPLLDDETIDLEIVPAGTPTASRIQTGIHYRMAGFVPRIAVYGG